MIGLDDQFFRNQLDRHRRVARENFVEPSGDGPKVIYDDDGNAQVGRQIPQQPDISVKATG